MEGHKYRVRMIKSWDGESKLIRSTVQDGQVFNLFRAPHTWTCNKQ